MSDAYVQYGVVVVIAALTGILAVIVLARKSLAQTRAIKISSAALVATAVSLALFNTFLRPPIPEAFAQCLTTERFAPTTITCTNRSEDYSRLEWTFEDGNDAGSGETIQRQISSPGTFTVSVTAYGQWPATETKRSFESKIVVEPEPRTEPERKTVTIPLSQAGRGAGTYSQVFSADPGFKIVDAKLIVTSAASGRAQFTNRTDSTVTVTVELTQKVSFRGLSIRKERSWLNAQVVLVLERLE